MSKEKLLSTIINNQWQALPWNKLSLYVEKYAAKWVFVLLLVLLAQTSAELTWSFFDKGEVSNKALLTPTKNQNSSVKSKTSHLNEVVQYHLFGDAKAQAVATPTKVINAPDTRLQLILKGVFAATKPKNALAIIATKKGKGKSYRIGDKLNGGAVLHAVYADRVILKRNGKLETLRLPKVATQNLYSKSSSSLPQSVNERSVGLMSAASKTKLKDIRKTLLTNPSKMWKQVRINPVMKKGKVQGYTLFHKDKALMNSLGLRKTDVILAVNGENLSDPSTLYSLMGMLSEEQGFDITIERGGKRQSIQLNF